MFIIVGKAAGLKNWIRSEFVETVSKPLIDDIIMERQAGRIVYHRVGGGDGRKEMRLHGCNQWADNDVHQPKDIIDYLNAEAAAVEETHAAFLAGTGRM